MVIFNNKRKAACFLQTYKLKTFQSISCSSILQFLLSDFLHWSGWEVIIKLQCRNMVSVSLQSLQVGRRKSLGALGPTSLHTKSLALGCSLMSLSEKWVKATLEDEWHYGMMEYLNLQRGDTELKVSFVTYCVISEGFRAEGNKGERKRVLCRYLSLPHPTSFFVILAHKSSHVYSFTTDTEKTRLFGNGVWQNPKITKYLA